MKTPDSERDAPDDAWDDLFRQRLADHTDQPPAHALNRILAGATPPRPPLYRRWVPVSVVLLLLVGAGGLLVRHASSLKPTAGAGPPTLPAPRTNPTPKKAPADAGAAQFAAESAAVGNIPTRPVWPDHREEVAVDRTREPDESIQPPPLAASASKTRVGNRRTIPEQLPDGRAIENEPVGAPSETQTRNARSAGDGYASSNRVSQTQPMAIRITRLARPTRSESVTLDKAAIHEPTRPDGDGTATVVTLPGARLLAVNLLAGRPFHTYNPVIGLPIVAAPPFTGTPQASRPVRRPVWFVSVTPLYNYHQINPIQTDAELVSDVRGTHSLASNRLGGRGQLGLEWPLTSRLSLRTSLVYQQVRQSLRYAVRSTQPDSVRVVVVDNQSVQVTPIFARQNHAETTVWHYTGASTDLAWQLNRQHSDRWQHSVTVGATVGRYTSRGGAVNGFVQAAYSVERPLTANLRFRVEPTIQVGWQALSHEANRFQSLPYSYGLALGLRFR